MKNLFLSAFFVFSTLFGFSQIPADYYDATQGFGGDGLKTVLYNIIKGHTEYEYTTDTTDVWDILKETDKDPDNSANVILLYTGWTVDAAQEWNDGNGWNREHVWAKSHGQFDPDIVGLGAGTDVHHLRPCDPSVNSARNNRWFAECSEEYIDTDGATGSYTSSTDWIWKPRDEVKGDVARMMFYMATRYEGENGEPDLELIDYIPADNNSPLPLHAKLSDLLAWHLEDPVDDWERGRNETIYSYQNNANPFIDHPEWVECIWNNSCSDLWFTSYPMTDLTEREDYSYFITASSSEALGLTVTSETTLPAWLTFTSVTSELSSATATLIGSPEFSDIGTYPVSLKLSDGTTDVFQNFDIVVVDGNPITFTSNPITDGIAGQIYNYIITVTGDGGAAFNLTGTQLPTWLSLTNNSGATATLTGTPAIENIGELNSVILTVTDDTKKTITQEFDINIIHPDDANTIIISQYYEGVSNDKYIEITNVGNFNLDLSNYHLGRWGNTDSPSGVYTSGDALSGTINAGQTLIYKNASAVNPSYAANSAYGTTIATYFNGNDPVALLKGGDTWEDRVDCIYGLYSVVEYWGSETGFYRNANILAGNKNNSVLDGTGEWTEISIDEANNATEGTIEYLGYHLDNSINIRELNSQVKLYPNPVNNILFIETELQLNTIEIYNVTTQLIKQINNYNANLGIGVSELEKGLYVLKITNINADVSFVKFIKQ